MKMTKTLFFALLSFPFFGQITIFETDFQGGIPSEMTLINNDSNTLNPTVSEYTEAWICVPDPVNTGDSVAASTSWFQPIDTADRWIITPQLTLGNYGNSMVWDAKSQDASYPDDYYVLASTSDLNPLSFTDTLGYIQEENFEWTSRSVDLSAAGYNGQSIYIAFVLRTFDGYKLYIDDIQVVKEDAALNDDIAEIEFKVFPNPCEDNVKISSPSPIDDIQLYNLSGKIILSTKTPTIDTSALKRGSYIVKIWSGGHSSHKTLFKL
jgi:hypothetical protein